MSVLTSGEEAPPREQAERNGGQGSEEQLRQDRAGGDSAGSTIVHPVPPSPPTQDVGGCQDVRRRRPRGEVGSLAEQG